MFMQFEVFARNKPCGVLTVYSDSQEFTNLNGDRLSNCSLLPLYPVSRLFNLKLVRIQ